jgi:PKD repeat protein
MTRFLLILLCFYFSTNHRLKAQSTRDVAVELNATVLSDTPTIILKWSANDVTSQYQIRRKEKNATTWGNVIATLSGSAEEYVDTNVSTGVSYEYRVTRTGNNFTGYGYVNAGILISPTEYRGKLLLLLDKDIEMVLADEIYRLKQDLEGDGWTVIPLSVGRQSPVADVKGKIKDIYNLDKVNTKALFILGHVPVPYSGNLNPDGHPDHQGAWPADVFYGDMDGIWTDNSVNNIGSSDPRNKNIPGDGKFDQSVLPSNVELQIGRVDFANMTAFQDSETELLRKYLNKDHAYRHKMISTEKRAVIHDNFGYFSGEAFAASGWRNFGPLVGKDNAAAGDYFSTLSSGSYQWSYGCGGGTYTSAGGVGSTSDFKDADLKSIFTMLFGSYFGDWDSGNNFLRAPLAQGTTLTNVWAGRPHWYFHHMGLGENIGYSVKQTQNNTSLYYTHYAGRFIHIALMGDPTLRNDVTYPVAFFTAVKDQHRAILKWKPAPGDPTGYFVYVKSEDSPEFTRLNDKVITDTFFVDSCKVHKGIYVYMIRSVELLTSPSGTYYNLSQGVFDTLFVEKEFVVKADADYSQQNSVLTFTNKSENASEYLWNFGDGTNSTEINPVKYFPFGMYNVTLVASNECGVDSIVLPINIITSTNHTEVLNTIGVFPNPGEGIFNVRIPDNAGLILKSEIVDMFGNQVKLLCNDCLTSGIDMTACPPGMYVIRVFCENGVELRGKLMILK